MTAHPDDENSSLIQIFIGEHVQNNAEGDCLRAVCRTLEQMRCWAYVFVSFHAAGRQIDLTVFTEKVTLLIEVKAYSLPIRGEKNGQWVQHGPYGARNVGNGYVQALNAKNALRDEMQRISRIDGYPNGLVAITPAIPDGSALTSGDFKVGVMGFEHVDEALAQSSGALLTPELCERLAKHLSLEPVASVDAAVSEDVLAAERACSTYLKAFDDFYSPLATRLVSDRYRSGGQEIGPAEVQSMVFDSASGVQIKGPSGCGKSLLAASCAVACAATDCIPIFVSAKDFDGEFQRFLDREVTLLDARSARGIVSASKRVGKRIILFLDGYNECGDDLKARLTRAVKAFVSRHNAGVVISTQQDIVRADLLSMKDVIVERPSDALKAALAGMEGQEDLGGNLHALLGVVNSGLEAGLVGQAGALLPPGASSFALFDTYARKKLGAAASEGIRVLSRLADALVQRASFSLSVREFDRIGDALNIGAASRQQLLQAQLLQVRGDRISFVHELFFSAFSAEAAMRSAEGDVRRVRAALGSPRFFSSKALILGAIEDDDVLHEVLEDLADANLIAACVCGECGATAQFIMKRKLDQHLALMIEEAKGVRFQFVGEGWYGVAIDEASLRPELKDFHSYLAAIGRGVMDGHYHEIIMAACAHMDEAIAAFSVEFAAESKARKVPLRHGMFSMAYVMSQDAAISNLIRFIHSGGLPRHGEGKAFGRVVKEGWEKAKTSGQFYFLTGITRFTSLHKEAAPYLVRLLQNIRSLPYHLQLASMDFARYIPGAEEPYRTEMIDALNASLDKLGGMMNTIIFDALKGLGALKDEEEEHLPAIREEIQSALMTDGDDADATAWSLFSRQFDHPFDTAYWEEIQGLDDVKKKLLFTKAVRGAIAPYVSFLGILIQRLADFNDSGVASAIARWIALPDKKSFIPQDAIEVFVNAHEALGHLGADLPGSEEAPASAADKALLACGELYYWGSRADVQDPQTSAHTAAARAVLLDHALCASAGVLQLTASRYLTNDGSRVSLVKSYPDVSLSVCREAIKRRHEQISYFEHGFRDDVAGFAIQVLAELGGSEDLSVLRDLCDTGYGVIALDAIRRIEDRTRFRSA